MSEPSEDPSPVEPVPPPPSAAADDREYHRRRESAVRSGSTKKAAKWVLVVAIMQLVIGTFLGLREQPTYDKALKEIAWISDKFQPVEGETTTVGELRTRIERERIQVLAIPIGIGLAFVALFFWARKSPLPALITAFALFVVVHAVSAVVDPTQLYQGILIKVFFIAALIKGIRSALEERVLSQSIQPSV